MANSSLTRTQITDNNEMLENEDLSLKALPAHRQRQVFTNVLQDPRQPALPFYPQLPSPALLRSLLWTLTPLHWMLPLLQHSSPPAGINSGRQAFPSDLAMKCAL